MNDYICIYRGASHHSRGLLHSYLFSLTTSLVPRPGVEPGEPEAADLQSAPLPHTVYRGIYKRSIAEVSCPYLRASEGVTQDLAMLNWVLTSCFIFYIYYKIFFLKNQVEIFYLEKRNPVFAMRAGEMRPGLKNSITIFEFPHIAAVFANNPDGFFPTKRFYLKDCVCAIIDIHIHGRYPFLYFLYIL